MTALCPKPVFVDEGWPLGQCLRKPGHQGLCDVYNGSEELDPKQAHYATKGCVKCGSVLVEYDTFCMPVNSSSDRFTAIDLARTCQSCGTKQ